MLSNSKAVLVLTESKHIEKDDSENVFKFSLTNFKEIFPFVYYIEN